MHVYKDQVILHVLLLRIFTGGALVGRILTYAWIGACLDCFPFVTADPAIRKVSSMRGLLADERRTKAYCTLEHACSSSTHGPGRGTWLAARNNVPRQLRHY